jgi:hypothetical protein
MIRITVVACLLGACFQSHPADQPELAGTDCYGCHTRDYVATTTPVHRAAPDVYSTACASCHATVHWDPALEGRHSDAFLVSDGPHAPIACLDCHQLGLQPSKAGANTNCIQCHPNDAKQVDDHSGVTSVANVPYIYQASVPNFCLQCHPAGTAIHPDDKFALRADHAVPCADCHDRGAGKDKKGGNVTCVESRCHHTLRSTDGTEGHSGGDYTKARGNGSSRNFCHTCHS